MPPEKTMTFSPVREILDKFQQLHRQAAAYCAEAAASSDERVSLLMNYFQQWEQAQAKCLEALDEDERKAVLDTYVQFGPDKLDEAIASLCQAKEQGGDALIKGAFALQNETIDSLDRLAKASDVPAVSRLLDELAGFAQRAAQNLGMADVTRRDA